MKFDVHPCFKREEAQIALLMLELVIDALIHLHGSMTRMYDLVSTEELPF